MQELWAPRIYTSSGFVREDVLEGKKVLDIGCGARKLPGAVGVDSLSLPGVDVLHNLAQFPWPLASGSFDLVFANHYLEHAPDVFKALGEVHRVLKERGRFVVQVPYFRSVDAFSDPTHQHFFTSSSLDYVITGTKLGEYAYTPFAFKQVGFWYGWPQSSRNPFTRWFKAFIIQHRKQYDQYLSLLLPFECLTWELERI